MKKSIFLLIVFVIVIMMVGCKENNLSRLQSSQDIITETNSGNRKLSDEELAKTVAEKLGVPDKDKITYTVGEETFWEAAEVYYKNVTFYENGDMVAWASVNPLDGELLRNIFKYKN